MSKKKISTQSTLTDLKNFINAHDYFYVLGHEKPDGDCIGSQLAMAGLLTILGKTNTVLSAGPFSDSISRSYEPIFTNSIKNITKLPKQGDREAVIFLDASTPDRMGKIFEPIYKLPIAIIDHHASVSNNCGDIRYIEPKVPANTILVYRLYKEFGIVPTKEQAYYILLGILTDTQFFRFVKKDDPEPLLVAADLIALGVTPNAIYQQISYGYTYSSRKVIAKILDRTQRLNNSRIILTYISYNDYIQVDDIPQSYEIYQMLEGTHKTEMVVYMQEILDDNNTPICKIGMRSKKINVGSFAKTWRGGGHQNASGFTIKKPLSETLPILVNYFDKLLI